MIVYENPWFRVVKDGQFHIVEENTGGEGAAVLPLVGDDILLLEMKRPSQGRELTLEIPRGFGEAGEVALTCAQRELKEETGYDLPLEAFSPLGHVRPNTGIMSSRIALFVARIAPDTPHAEPDQEAAGRRLLPLTQLNAALSSGMIEDGFTLSALALFLARAEG